MPKRIFESLYRATTSAATEARSARTSVGDTQGLLHAHVVNTNNGRASPDLR